MTTQSPKNKGQCFVSKPRVTKGIISPNLQADFSDFPRNSVSECSAYPSGLHHSSLHSFPFGQPLPARASGPLTPGPRADPRRRCAPRRNLRVPPPLAHATGFARLPRYIRCRRSWFVPRVSRPR
jgi:hypothetical protein